MAPKNHRVVFEADDDLVALIEVQQRVTGASVSEICRRALRWTLAARRVENAESESQRVARVESSLVDAARAQK